jgi:TAG lipase/steryl ester hydrolase/phospholipase A2/LPA acyltransferase
VIDLVFVPRVVFKQLLLLIALDAGLVTVQQVTSVLHAIFISNFSSRSRLIRQLIEEQNASTTQDEWMDLAERIDNVLGNDAWRSDPECSLYERDRIAARIDEYVHLMRRRDIFELMFVLRGSIGRNKFGLLHEGLFTKAMAGSKVLTETYHNVVCAALDFVCDAPVLPGEEPIPTDMRLAFFNETRHAYGRTALLLSGGAALGFYHVGVVKTLMENRLLPRVIGGSSAGSILCAMLGTRTDEECFRDFFEVRGTDAPGHYGKLAINFFRPIHKTNPEDNNNSLVLGPSNTTTGYRRRTNSFWRVYHNTAGAFHDAKRTIQGFVPIPLRKMTSFLYDVLTGNTRPQDIFKNDTAHFRECVRVCVGNFTFQEAFDRTGRILNIVVTPNNATDPPRLLNYLTAPHVMVWSAAVASSSLPGVFEANRLVIKEADGWERYESGGTQVFSDGSMEQDLPMQQLSEMFNINHFIISQANPHAVMFASYKQKVSVWTNPLIGFVQQIVGFLRNQVRAWLLHFVQCFGANRITPLFETQRGIGAQFFTQEYEGRTSDISLIPWIGHRSLLGAMMHIIYNPSEAEFREWIQAAERETWKYIPRIKSHIAEEITLDRCVQRLRRRLLQESWDKHSGAKVGGRVPSFFTSNSLVNLSGLGVSDQPATDDLHEYAQVHALASPPPLSEIKPDIDLMNSGWGGMGLKGNRSSGNLQRSTSDASGLFFDDEDQQPQAMRQEAGETTHAAAAAEANNISRKASDAGLAPGGYVKTTSMAKFYYRRTAGSIENMQRTSSDSHLKKSGEGLLFHDPNDTNTTNSHGGKIGRHARQKSKSHTELVHRMREGMSSNTEEKS